MAYPALARLQKHPSAASICAERGYIDCLKVLLMHGIDVNSVDNKGRTLLLKACARNHTAVVKYLLDQKADVRMRDRVDDFTCVHAAAAVGHNEALELLLEVHPRPHDAGELGGMRMPDARADWGLTPLMVAAMYGHPSTVRLLLQRGADPRLATVNSGLPRRSLVTKLGPHSTALHLAAAKGFTECAWELLRENPSLLTMANGNGWTPEFVAARRQHRECALFLTTLLADDSAFRSVRSARDLAARLKASLGEAVQAAGSAAPRDKQGLEDETCDICFEEGRTMVHVLPCRHTLCSSCATKVCEPARPRFTGLPTTERALLTDSPPVPARDNVEAAPINCMQSLASQNPQCPFCRTSIDGFRHSFECLEDGMCANARSNPLFDVEEKVDVDLCIDAKPPLITKLPPIHISFNERMPNSLPVQCENFHSSHQGDLRCFSRDETEQLLPANASTNSACAHVRASGSGWAGIVH